MCKNINPHLTHIKMNGCKTMQQIQFLKNVSIHEHNHLVHNSTWVVRLVECNFHGSI